MLDSTIYLKGGMWRGKQKQVVPYRHPAGNLSSHSSKEGKVKPKAKTFIPELLKVVSSTKIPVLKGNKLTP